MPKVYVAQEGPFNYTPAEKYGDIEFLSVDEISPQKNSIRNARTVGHIRKSMHDYEPGKDYLLMSGSPIAIAYMLQEAFGRPGDFVHNLLKWDGQMGEYLLYELES